MEKNSVKQFLKHIIMYLLIPAGHALGIIVYTFIILYFFDVPFDKVTDLVFDSTALVYFKIIAEYIGQILLFIFFYQLFFGLDFSALTFRRKISIINVLKYGLIFFIIRFCLETVLIYIFSGGVIQAFHALQDLSLLFLGILTYCITSTFEEIFFRGLLLRNLFNYSNNVLLSSVVVSVIFSLAHWSSSKGDILQYLEHFIWSLPICWIAIKHRSLDIVIGVHIAGNILYDFVFSIEKSNPLFIRPDSVFYDITVTIVSFSIFLTYLYWHKIKKTILA